MTPGFFSKTYQILMMLARVWLRMDFVARHETRLPQSSTIMEREFTFFWQSKPFDESMVWAF